MKKVVSILLSLLMCLPLLISYADTETDTGTSPLQNSDTASSADAPVLSGITIAGTNISDYVIVKPTDASECEAYAAEELSTFIEKACGVKLEIVTEPTSERTISLIRDTSGELGDEGFIIKTEDDKLTITGGTKNGILLGVYEFLESYIGWCFLREGQNYLKSEGTIEIPDDIEDKQIPIMEYRYAYSGANNGKDDRVRRKLNVNLNVPKYGGFFVPSGSMMHTFGILLNGEHSLTEQPCLSDENVYQTILASVFKILTDYPESDYISVSQDDNWACCQCENCTKIALEEGVDVTQEDGTVVREARQSGPILRFVNRIAQAVYDAGYTNVKINTFAYQYSVKPPSVTKCRDNVIIWMCSISECYQHAFNDPECNKYGGIGDGYFNNAVWAEALKGWTKICNAIYFYEYQTNYDCFTIPYMDFHILRDNYQFYAENKGIGVYSPGSRGSNVEFGALRVYLTSKLLWNPYMTDEEYEECINDFMQCYYGSGWKAASTYFDLAQKSSIANDMCFHTFAVPSRMFRPLDYVLYEEEMVKLFDQAEMDCRTAGEEAQLKNLTTLRLSYTFMKLSSNYTANWTFGSEKIREEYLKENNALHDSLIASGATYSLEVKDCFRDGYPPTYWWEKLEMYEGFDSLD